MLWLEMRRNPDRGISDWNFPHSMWSPTHKRGSDAKWAFWELLLSVKIGDTILHLHGKDRAAAFIGLSIADGDGFATQDRPTRPGPYAYAREFYRVRLRDFNAFADPMPLTRLFADSRADLRAYFEANAAKPPALKRHLFYVLQAGRMQCLNGAYLSEVDDELAGLILGPDMALGPTTARPTHVSVVTGEQIRQAAARIGQDRFSAAVRANYENRCCFPGCNVDDPRFLVGAHIARWTDAPDMRGDLANGLCLCLLHDKAFEIGVFTLTETGTVAIHRTPIATNGAWSGHLAKFAGVSISIPSGAIKPSARAVQMHWARIGFVGA